MNKLIPLLISILIIIPSLSLNSFALSTLNSESSAIYLENGNYIIITLEDITLSRASNTKTGRRTLNYYNSDNEVLWSATLTATFTYTGTSATCTSTNITHNINDSSWNIISATSSRSGNTATGNVIAKHYFAGIPIKTVEETFSITCSATGVLS